MLYMVSKQRQLDNQLLQTYSDDTLRNGDVLKNAGAVIPNVGLPLLLS